MFILLPNEKLEAPPWAICARTTHFCKGAYKKTLTPNPYPYFVLNHYSQQSHVAALITITPTQTLDLLPSPEISPHVSLWSPQPKGISRLSWVIWRGLYPQDVPNSSTGVPNPHVCFASYLQAILGRVFCLFLSLPNSLTSFSDRGEKRRSKARSWA
jgi:hypothetical protein